MSHRSFTAQSAPQQPVVKRSDKQQFRSFTASALKGKSQPELTPQEFLAETTSLQEQTSTMPPQQRDATTTSSTMCAGSTKQQPFTDLTLRLLFVVFMTLNLLNNIDHGVLPAGSITIKSDLGQNNLQYGLIGSAVFAGLTLGTIAATFAYQLLDTKVVLSTVLALEAVSLVLFCHSYNFYFLLFIRFLTGFFQVFISIYFPVWADTFGGNDKQKTMWLTGLLLCSPIGVLLGYTLCASLVSYGVNWRYALYIQAILFVPTITAILMTPLKYFDLENARLLMKQADEQPASPSSDSERELISQRTSQQYFGFSAAPSESNQATAGTGTSRKESTLNRVYQVVKNPFFIYMALALSTLYFITTGLQYWISDYLQIVMKAPADEVFYFYAFTCLSAPFMGVITGGIAFSSLGGYNSPKAFPLMLVIGVCAVGAAIPAPFMDSKWAVYIMMWFLFYFGAFLLPTMTGIMLNSVDGERRTTANSVATLWYNLFGYLPAPFVYGFVSTLGSNVQLASRWALGCLMFTTIITAVLLVLSYFKNEERLQKEALSADQQKPNDIEELPVTEGDDISQYLTGDTGGGTHYLRKSESSQKDH